MTIIIFIALLLILVLAHEWGHFFAARRLGVGVEEFGFGFPPRAWSRVKNGVRYSLNWLPLGGFVKLKGENGGEESATDSFSVQKAWKRSTILVAGVGMNVVLAFVLLSIGFAVGTPTVLENDAQLASDVKIVISQVLPDSPAAKVGVKAGDEIVTVNNEKFTTLSSLQNYLKQAGSVEVKLNREGKEVVVNTKPEILPSSGERRVLGVGLMQVGLVKYVWYEAVWRGAQATGFLLVEIARAFGNLISNLIVRGSVPSDIAGPVGIATMTGQVADLGWRYLLQFAALLSLNLAWLNILPFPALDGGRLLFVIIEKIRGKVNNQKIEAIAHQIGFGLLMLLVLAITYRDLVKLGKGLWGG